MGLILNICISLGLVGKEEDFHLIRQALDAVAADFSVSVAKYAGT